MWLSVPDDFQVHMLDKELVNFCTGQPGTGVTLPSAKDAADATDPIIRATLSVLAKIAQEAQTIVQGHLLSQGVLADTLPAGPNAGLLLHVATHIAFEHLFLRIPGKASEFPTAWDKSIVDAHATLRKFVEGDIPLDPDFFVRGAESNVPPQSAVMRSSTDVDLAFARDWNLPTRRSSW